MIKAPFVYFGGKSRVAEVVWSRFGKDIKMYLEPFCGSMATLLYHDQPPGFTEVVNDFDGLLINTWRAIQREPEALAALCEVPVSAVELTARHNEVTRSRDMLQELSRDPDYYDVKMAAYWLYARSCLIGGRGIFQETIGIRIPAVMTERGIMREEDKGAYLQTLAKRLQGVKILASSWERVVASSLTRSVVTTPCAVFLDPPYELGEYDDGVYAHPSPVWDDVVAWCRENGDDPNLRIALCGYEGGADLPGWEEYAWSTGGGMGVAYRKEGGATRGAENRHRERIWFSPHCKKAVSQETELDLEAFFGG